METLRDQPELLLRTRHLTYHAQHGKLFAYHNQMGFIIEMSRDIVDVLEFHVVTLRTREEVDSRFEGQFEDGQLDEFIQVLKAFGCLLDSELEEERSLWRKVPVRSRWTVFHQPSPTELTFWRMTPDGPAPDVMEPWAAKAWARMDGETNLRDIMAGVMDDASLLLQDNPEKHVLETVIGWVHRDRQYLKFAAAPLSKFGAKHQWPSYLKSTMPFAQWIPGIDPDPVDILDTVAEPLCPPHDYYEGDVEDADAQFRDVETTLSHLFRHPTPLLAGETYAIRTAKGLFERGLLGPHVKRVVEVGAGLGDFAAGVLSTIAEREPAIYDALSYTIVDLSPALRERQARTLAEAGHDGKVSWVAANAETHDFGEDSIDLLLCNEVVGDFTTLRLTREVLGLSEEMDPSAAYEKWSEETVEKLGDAGRLIKQYTLPLRDAKDDFYLNLGALQFLERIAGAIAPGGGAFITEYGDLIRYPIAGTHLDHLEFSIQFGHMLHVARANGLEGTMEYVQDLIGLDREAHTLETTRTYFSALRGMLASFGLDLDKRAYSEAMLRELLGDKIALETIGDIRFRVIDERCMGLAPHEFKALVLKRADV